MLVVVDLAHYRRGKTSPSMDQWKDDWKFCVTFAAYLRKRAGSVEVDPDGLKRLAVTFDLRRPQLMSSLRSMLNEQYLIQHATIATVLAERLEDSLAIPVERTSSASVVATAYQLARALDAVAAALDVKLPSAHLIR